MSAELPVGAVKHQVRRGTKKVLDVTDTWLDRSHQWARAMDRIVSERTWIALGIALAGGIICGLSISRK